MSFKKFKKFNCVKRVRCEVRPFFSYLCIMELEINSKILVWNENSELDIPEGIVQILKSELNLGYLIDLLGAQQPLEFGDFFFYPFGWEESDEFEPIANVKVYFKDEYFDDWLFGVTDEEPFYTLLQFKI